MGLLLSLLISLSQDAFCEESRRESQNANAPEKWGIAMGIRSATIPFETNTSTVNDVVPLIFMTTAACLSTASSSVTGFFKMENGNSARLPDTGSLTSPKNIRTKFVNPDWI
jgi:hypothetical protein